MKHPVRSGFAAGSALFCGPLIFLVPGFFLLACISEEDRALQDPPIISSASYQHTLYTGSPQPIEARAAKDDVAPLLITYFPSEQALLRNEGGSRAPPSEVGDYYVRIERPGGNGYKRGRDIKVEYHIQKAFVAIVADPVQRFVYDGAPKEPVVRSEPPVELHILYTPVPAAGIAGAAGAAGAAGDATEDPPVLNFPPSGRGVYRVTIVFSGNERYMGASRDIELRIE